MQADQQAPIKTKSTIIVFLFTFLFTKSHYSHQETAVIHATGKGQRSFLGENISYYGDLLQSINSQ